MSGGREQLNIKVAQSAGFCFGVNRAVDKVNDLVRLGNKVCTLGPIIHNPQVIKKLENDGVLIVDDPKDVKKDYCLVIRSHGISPDILEEIKSQNINYYDATCPFVKKIHKIVKEYSQNGYNILIAGDENHPEVIGIKGYSSRQTLIFNSYEMLNILHSENLEFFENNVCVVAQTTFNTAIWEKSLKKIKNLCTNFKIFDTICSATVERQNEAMDLSRKSDLMIVIGGKNSSNTKKLRDVCSANCDTVLIEDVDEMPTQKIKRANLIGITAGASTPPYIIKEAINHMAEILNSSAEEQNFEQMLEESLRDFNFDEKVHGVVVGITPTEVFVDVGRKQAGFIPASEISYDPVNPADAFKIGDELDLLIMKTNDQEGTIMLSKKRLDAMKAWDKFIEANKEETILSGKVKNVIKGGVVVESDGVRVFVPASLATLSRNSSLDALVGQTVDFRVIEVNRRRRRCVGSIKSVLEEQRAQLANAFWESVEVGKVYHGQVKSLTSYGAFVDLGGVDGMIHISELSWVRIKHPSEVVKVDDSVEVYIKDVDKEKGKISLGFKKSEDNPWVQLKNLHKAGDVVDVEIVSMTTFGAFARIIPGVDGLIHISQISDRRIEKPQDELKIGQVVSAKITDIDFENKRVSLSIRALLDKEPQESVEEIAE